MSRLLPDPAPDVEPGPAPEAVGTPPFDDAVAQLRSFLGQHGHRGEPLWVFREDVAHHVRPIYVGVPLPAINLGRAAALYGRGRKRGLGVVLEVLCLLGGRPCCFVFIPQDEREASHLMIPRDGLKLSFPSELQDAHPVDGLLRWWALRAMVPRAAEWLAERIPSRDLMERGVTGRRA